MRKWPPQGTWSFHEEWHRVAFASSLPRVWQRMPSETDRDNHYRKESWHRGARTARSVFYQKKKKQRRLYQWSIAIPVFEGVPDPRQHAIKRCDCCLQLWLFCFYSIFFRSIILCVCLCVCRQATYIAVFPWNKSVVSSASVSSFFVFSVLVCSARFSLSNEPTSPTAYFTKKADPDLQRYLPVRFRKGAFVIADASAITSLSLKGTNRTRAAIDHYFYHTLCANSFVNINPVFFALLPIGKRIIKRI